MLTNVAYRNQSSDDPPTPIDVDDDPHTPIDVDGEDRFEQENVSSSRPCRYQLQHIDVYSPL